MDIRTKLRRDNKEKKFKSYKEQERVDSLPPIGTRHAEEYLILCIPIIERKTTLTKL